MTTRAYKEINAEEAKKFIGQFGVFFDCGWAGKTVGILKDVGGKDRGFPFSTFEGSDYEYFIPSEKNFLLELVGFGQEHRFIKEGVKGIVASSFSELKICVEKYWKGEDISNRYGILMNPSLGYSFSYRLEGGGYSYQFFYPIKPEDSSNYRPFTMEELIPYHKKTFIKKENRKAYRLIDISLFEKKNSLTMLQKAPTSNLRWKGDEMFLLNSPAELFEDFTLEDGSPAGKKVE